MCLATYSQYCSIGHQKQGVPSENQPDEALVPPRTLVWIHIQQVHIIGAIHHFQESGVYSKLWHNLIGQETAVSPRVSALGSQDKRAA